VGSTPIADLPDFREAIKEEDLQRGIRMQVKREGVRRFVFLKSNG
jgi:hypothetical protein